MFSSYLPTHAKKLKMFTVLFLAVLNFSDLACNFYDFLATILLWTHYKKTSPGNFAFSLSGETHVPLIAALEINCYHVIIDVKM